MLLPASIYVLTTASGWRRAISHATALCAAFALPLIAYCCVSYVLTGHFWLSGSGAATVYGRMAAAADCATLRLPVAQQPLCPTPQQKRVASTGLECTARARPFSDITKTFRPPMWPVS
jgi:hypothetical protein